MFARKPELEQSQPVEIVSRTRTLPKGTKLHHVGDNVWTVAEGEDQWDGELLEEVDLDAPPQDDANFTLVVIPTVIVYSEYLAKTGVLP